MANSFTLPVRSVCKFTGIVEDVYELTLGNLLAEILQADGIKGIGLHRNELLGVEVEWAADQANRPPGMELKVAAVPEAGQEGQLDSTQAATIEIRKYGGVTVVANQDFDRHFHQRQIGAGFFTQNAKLSFHSQLDTDAPRLLDALKKMEKDFQTSRVRQTYQGLQQPNPRPFNMTVDSQGTRLELLVRLNIHRAAGSLRTLAFGIIVPYEISDLTPYSGYAAIDCGNSGSTLAIKEGSGTSLSDLRIVHIDRENRDSQEAANPVLKSAVYFRSLEADKQSEFFPKVDHVAGDAALEQDNVSRLVVSPKRFLGKAPTEFLPFDKTRMSCHFPLHLLLTSVLQEAHYQTGNCFHIRPRGKGNAPLQSGLAITYPSTFSEREIRYLRDGYRAAVVRAFQQKLGPADVPTPEMVDEASAAAFFFLYRDFFFSAGGVTGFNYVYPNGANILIIDVGGGTTDVALVHCRARLKTPPEQASEDDNSAAAETATAAEYVIRMDVLGRTGLRLFGGDNITVAVFRVLKAEVARFLSQDDVDLTFDPARSKQSFHLWYQSRKARFDELVPTESVGRERKPDEIQTRRRLTKAMWQWAEKVKAWLSGHESDASDPAGEQAAEQRRRRAFNIVEGSLLDELLQPPQAFTDGIFGNDASESQRTTFLAQLPARLKAFQPHIDAQIAAELEKLLTATNFMVEEKLPRDDHQFPEELHRVYIVGQAAYYPALRDGIAKQLALEIINHKARAHEPEWESRTDFDVRRLVFDETELKHSVAKGAALLNFVSTAVFEAEFERDKDLVNRLPYDILFESAVRGNVPVYNEGDNYLLMTQHWKTLTEVKIRVAENGERVRTIALMQCWPGERENPDPPKFFEFELRDPVQGELMIQYRMAATPGVSSGFVLKDAGRPENAEIPGRWLPLADSLPPMQRGDL